MKNVFPFMLRSGTWLALLLLSVSLLAFNGYTKLVGPGLEFNKYPTPPSKGGNQTDKVHLKQASLATNDPIRFSLQANKRQVLVGETVELTVTAELMNISPKLMFFLPGANAYTLRLLLPDGFQQTGGDNLSEYVTTELAYPNQATKTYRVSGFFSALSDGRACFRLLRGPAQATNQSVFVDKGSLCLPVYNQSDPAGARLATSQNNLGSAYSQCVEAESGNGNRDNSIFSDGQASAGRAVGGFGNESEFMTYTLPNIPQEADYTLRLYYVSGDAQAGIGLVVNQVQTQLLTPDGVSRQSGPYAEATTTIHLLAGSNNTLRVQGRPASSTAGSFNLDRFCIEGAGDSPSASLAISPSGQQNVNTSAGNLAVTVTATNVTWSVNSSDGSWLSVSPGGGSASGQVIVSYLANTSTNSRSTNITFSGAGVTNQTLTVTQAANNPATTMPLCVEAESGNGNRDNSIFSDGQASAGRAVGGLGWSGLAGQSGRQVLIQI